MRYRAGAKSVRGAAFILALSCTAAFAGEPATIASDPAHTLAQKFAGDAPPVASLETTPTKKMVAEAPATPTLSAPTQSGPTFAATAPPAKIGPQRPSLEYEMEMLRRARSEAADRKIKSSPTVDTKVATPSVMAATKPAQSASEFSAPVTSPLKATPSTPTATASPAVIKAVAPFATTTVTPPAVKAETNKAATKVELTAETTPTAFPDTSKVIGVRPTAAVVAPEAAPLPTSAIAAPHAIATEPAASPLPVISPPLAVATPPSVPAKMADAKLAELPAKKAPEAVLDKVPAQSPSQPPSQKETVQEQTSQATILLILEPHGQPTPPATPAHDALVCIGEMCVVSNGFEAAAKVLSRAEAQGLKTSDGVTLDSCRGKSACVFREVSVSSTPRIGVLDLVTASGNAGGDAYTTDVDTSCRVADGELMCDHPLATPDFRVWVVPEAIAKKAGATLLENAIVEGLPQSDVVSSTDK